MKSDACGKNEKRFSIHSLSNRPAVAGGWRCRWRQQWRWRWTGTRTAAEATATATTTAAIMYILNPNIYSPFHIVHIPYAIATPATIFASGAMNRTRSPNATHTPPSQVVLSGNLSFTHPLIKSISFPLMLSPQVSVRFSCTSTCDETVNSCKRPLLWSSAWSMSSSPCSHSSVIYFFQYTIRNSRLL